MRPLPQQMGGFLDALFLQRRKQLHLAATGLQAVVVTNPGWIMPSSASLDLTAFNYALSSGTVALSGLGSVDLVNKGLTMAVIPEPSTLTLFLLGLSSVFAVRRRCS